MPNSWSLRCTSRASTSWCDSPAMRAVASRRTASPACSRVKRQASSLLTLHVRVNDEVTATLTASSAGIDQDVRRLIELEALVAAAILLLGVVAVRQVTRAALRPLDHVAMVAEGIAAGDVDRRLRPSRADTELGRMAAAFDRMVDALQEALDRSRTSEAATRQFLADASHELRTPIARLQATAETLLREQPSRPDRDALEARLAGDAARLGRLVADLLDLARLDGAPAGIAADVDLHRVAQAALDEAATAAGRVQRGRGVRHDPARARRCARTDPGAAQPARQRGERGSARRPYPRDARGHGDARRSCAWWTTALASRRPSASGSSSDSCGSTRAAGGPAPASAWRSPAPSLASTAATFAATASSAARRSRWCSPPPAAEGPAVSRANASAACRASRTPAASAACHGSRH